MKKVILGLSLLGMGFVLAQEVSCVAFAQMSPKEANKTLDQFKKETHIRSLQKQQLQSEKLYVDNLHKRMYHINVCLYLRDANIHAPDTFVRAKALKVLSHLKLRDDEGELYMDLLDENMQFFLEMSRASLADKKVCSHPLVFLSSQQTAKGILVYENRYIGTKILTHHRILDPTQELEWMCGEKEAQNVYIGYLKEKGANLFLSHASLDHGSDEAGDLYSAKRFIPPSKQHTETSEPRKIYQLGMPLPAVDYLSGYKKTLRAGAKVIYLETVDNEVFFMYREVKFRALKYDFEKATQITKESL